jgi:hypothetical protein
MTSITAYIHYYEERTLTESDRYPYRLKVTNSEGTIQAKLIYNLEPKEQTFNLGTATQHTLTFTQGPTRMVIQEDVARKSNVGSLSVGSVYGWFECDADIIGWVYTTLHPTIDDALETWLIRDDLVTVFKYLIEHPQKLEQLIREAKTPKT